MSTAARAARLVRTVVATSQLAHTLRASFAFSRPPSRLSSCVASFFGLDFGQLLIDELRLFFQLFAHARNAQRALFVRNAKAFNQKMQRLLKT